MTIPVQAVREWLEAGPDWAAMGFQLYQGIWRDSTANGAQRLCVISAMGGRMSVDPTLDYDSVRVLFLGPTKGGADVDALRTFVYGLRDRLRDEYRACEVAQLRLQAAPVGPGFTAQDRPWFEINLELIS